MLKAIELENFKGIRDRIRLEFKPITLLFGRNSAGKSTVLQALLYTREILERNNTNADLTDIGGSYVDLGGFERIVHNHDMLGSVILNLEFDLEKSLVPEYGNVSGVEDILDAFSKFSSGGVEFEIKWGAALKQPYLSRYSTSFDGQRFASITASPDGKQIWLTDINDKLLLDLLSYTQGVVELPKSDIASEEDIQEVLRQKLEEDGLSGELDQVLAFFDSRRQVAVPSIGIQNLDTALPVWGKRLDIVYAHQQTDEDQTTSWMSPVFSTGLVGLGEILRGLLDEMLYLGPLREKPPRVFVTPKTEDRSRWCSGLGAWDALIGGDASFAQKASDWLADKDKLNAGYRLEVKTYKKLDTTGALYVALQTGRAWDDYDSVEKEIALLPEEKELSLIDVETGLAVLPQDVGVGISQVLPVVVAALNESQGVVAIEQPELHVHPAIQVGLGDLFLTSMERSKKLLLIETHSEHLMLRLLRRIRETAEGELPQDIPPISPDDVSVVYVEEQDSQVKVHHLRLSEDGDFKDRWPRGFFRERMEERF